MAESPSERVPPTSHGDPRPPLSIGWLVLVALLGATTVGVVGLIAGLVLLTDNRPTERVAGAVALIGAGLSFGLLANALLRR